MFLSRSQGERKDRKTGREKTKRRVLVLGSRHQGVDSHGWDKLPSKVPISDYDVIVLNLVPFERAESLRTRVRFDLLPSSERFRELLFRKSDARPMVIAIGDPTIHLEQEVGKTGNPNADRWIPPGGTQIMKLFWWTPVFPQVTPEPSAAITAAEGPFRPFFEVVKHTPAYLNLDQLWVPVEDVGSYAASVHCKANSLKIDSVQRLAENGAGRAVGIRFRLAAWYVEPIDRYTFGHIEQRKERIATSGDIVWLPSPTRVHDCEAVGLILQQILGVTTSEPEPEWLADWRLPLERELEQDMRAIREQIGELSEKLTAVQRETASESRFKKLLYETGKYELEPLVRGALSALGGHVIEPDTDADGNQVEDAFIRVGKQEAIAEIKGLDAGCKLKDIRQLTDWVNRAEERGQVVKGIAIINGFRKLPPTERPAVFDHQVVQRAEKQGFCLMTTFQLYQALVSLQEGTFTEGEFWKKVFETEGIFD